jgi:putative sugar O-methyltransferase
MWQLAKAYFQRLLDSFFRRRNSFCLTFQRDISGREYLISDSQKTFYEKSIDSILRSPFNFWRFRRIYNYREIVETVTYSQGKDYIDRIKQIDPNFNFDFLEQINNDKIGSPTVFNYVEVKKISPTTLRYLSVALEIKSLFGSNLNGKIVEIGAGYGGQASIMREFFDFNYYGIFDLPPAQELISRYLQKTSILKEVHMLSFNEEFPQYFDFALSNYAFSELPSELQIKYASEILSKAKKGYLIMNSGRDDTLGRNKGKLTISDLEACLPKFEILPEIPLTSPDNYVIVWGHNSQKTES